MRTVGIIQARMGSTRLPGKILKPIFGEPMLARMFERVKRAKLLDTVVVATSDKEEDDATATLAEQCGVGVFRGSEKDVLERFYQAARASGAGTVVRLTGDCPLHDGAVIDETIEHFAESAVEYTLGPANYPEGLDTEVFSFQALERAEREATLASEREHVTLYIRNHPELFRLASAWTSGVGEYSTMHWSVDTQADFTFVTKVFEQLYPANTGFTKDDVLTLLKEHPELLDINKGGTGYEGLAKSLKEDKEFKNKE